ncbi:MAG: PorP/SprF family type IX secretion system membrane protein [Ignavibacteriales bacterium]|nr:PorP/SprF family type IX secretion system membrane protein [Ignavibacteriales bacterium]
MKIFSQKKYYQIFFVCFTISIFTAQAQDAHFSQYSSSPLFLNPAMTGWTKKTYRIVSNYRSQGRSITPNNYITSSVSFDMSLFEKLGIGIFILNSSAGDGGLKTLDGKISASFNFPLGRKKYHHILSGVQGGLISKSINFSKLIFNNQFINGIFDPTISNGEHFGNSSISYWDVGAGMFWYYDKRSSSQLILPFFGVSVFHLTEPNESFLNGTSLLSKKIILYGGASYRLSETLFLIPQMLWMKQNTAKEINAGILAQYVANGNAFFFGSSFRFGDALIATTGVEYKSFTFGFSYDVNISQLNTGSNFNGGFELSLVYNGGEKSLREILLIPCFRF